MTQITFAFSQGPAWTLWLPELPSESREWAKSIGALLIITTPLH